MDEKPPMRLTCHECEVSMVVIKRAILKNGERLTWECPECGRERTLYVVRVEATSQNAGMPNEEGTR